MTTSTAERIRLEAHRRLGEGDRIDSSDLDVRLEGGTVVLEGCVDDAFAKSVVESVAREIAGPGSVESRISVRDDLGAEGGPRETEFGTAAGAREMMRTIPRP
jgi:osmotically-inducible protein OsmY